MRKSGAVGVVSVTSTVRASVVCIREKRCQDRPLRLDRRTPPAGHCRGGAGHPVPPVPRLQYRGASVSGGHTEIDLIARQGDLVTFVEVKTRRGKAFGSPLEAVTGAKRRELVKAARGWVDRFRKTPGNY